MKSLTQTQKLYFSLAGLAAILATVSFALIIPLIKKIEADSASLFQKKQASDALLRDQQLLISSKNDYQKIEDGLRALPAILPTQEVVKFIDLLENMARQTNNALQLTVIPNKDSAAEKKLTFEISLTGNFPSLIKFLLLLENASYFNDVYSLRITRLTPKTNAAQSGQPEIKAGDIETKINLIVYQK